MPTEFIAARYAADFQRSGDDGCADAPVGPADPRVVSRVGARIELAASLACPGAARRCLLADDPMELVDLDPAAALAVTQSSPTDPRPYARYFDDVRATGLQLLGADRPLRARLFLTTYFADRVNPFFTYCDDTRAEAAGVVAGAAQ